MKVVSADRRRLSREWLSVAGRVQVALITEDRPQRQAATQQGVTVHSLANLAAFADE